MAYVVTEQCIRCKYTDCVDVCPVDCFHEGPDMLVINPEICIDCGVCEPECPAEAIKPGSASMANWLEWNQKKSQEWPGINQSKAPLPNAEQHNGEAGKFEKYIKDRE